MSCHDNSTGLVADAVLKGRNPYRPGILAGLYSGESTPDPRDGLLTRRSPFPRTGKEFPSPQFLPGGFSVNTPASSTIALSPKSALVSSV